VLSVPRGIPVSSLNNAKNVSVEALDFDHVVNYPQPNQSVAENGELKPLESLECLTAAAALASKGRPTFAPS
jgi:hypothetical protein